MNVKVVHRPTQNMNLNFLPSKNPKPVAHKTNHPTIHSSIFSSKKTVLLIVFIGRYTRGKSSRLVVKLSEITSGLKTSKANVFIESLDVGFHVSEHGSEEES